MTGGPIARPDMASRFRWLTATRSTILQTSRSTPAFVPTPSQPSKNCINSWYLFTDPKCLFTPPPRPISPYHASRLAIYNTSHPDDLDDQSKFTGFDDGNRVKTINIVTQKDTRRGILAG